MRAVPKLRHERRPARPGERSGKERDVHLRRHGGDHEDHRSQPEHRAPRTGSPFGSPDGHDEHGLPEAHPLAGHLGLFLGPHGFALRFRPSRPRGEGPHRPGPAGEVHRRGGRPEPHPQRPQERGDHAGRREEIRQGPQEERHHYPADRLGAEEVRQAGVLHRLPLHQ